MISITIEDRVLAGLFLAIGSAQFMTVMMLGAAVAPDYSMHENAISDLGVIDETKLSFALSLFVIGLFNILAGFYFYKIHESRMLMTIFGLGGLGAMGAAAIPLDSPTGMHGLFALIAFLFINLQAILTARLVKGPMRIASVMVGIVGLVFLVVMALVDSDSIGAPLGIGHGGTERMIIYPSLIWMMFFGGYLLGSPTLNLKKL